MLPSKWRVRTNATSNEKGRNDERSTRPTHERDRRRARRHGNDALRRCGGCCSARAQDGEGILEHRRMPWTYRTLGWLQCHLNRETTMKRTLMILGLLLVTGCDLYRTNEGVGVLGPAGGWFQCFDETDCSGH